MSNNRELNHIKRLIEVGAAVDVKKFSASIGDSRLGTTLDYELTEYDEYPNERLAYVVYTREWQSTRMYSGGNLSEAVEAFVNIQQGKMPIADMEKVAEEIEKEIQSANSRHEQRIKQLEVRKREVEGVVKWMKESRDA